MSRTYQPVRLIVLRVLLVSWNHSPLRLALVRVSAPGESEYTFGNATVAAGRVAAVDTPMVAVALAATTVATVAHRHVFLLVVLCLVIRSLLDGSGVVCDEPLSKKTGRT